MKKLMVMTSLTALLFGSELTIDQKEAAQAFIKLYGYRCDSVNYAMRSSWDGSIRVTCNQSQYVYELKDVGGNWRVKVK